MCLGLDVNSRKSGLMGIKVEEESIRPVVGLVG